jgi:hypothetical protein
MSNVKDTSIAPCSSCGRETKHVVLAARKTFELVIGDDGEEYPVAENRFTLLECCGCEAVCLCHAYDYYPESDTTTRYFPPPLSRHRPKWLHALPRDMSSLLGEVYAALATDGRRLAAMGARALVDMVMENKVGDLGSFARKLEELEAQGMISRNNRQYLAAALDAGSAVAHRGHVPSVVAVNQVMDIVENLLEAVYVLPKAAAELQKETPPRIKRKIP